MAANRPLPRTTPRSPHEEHATHGARRPGTVYTRPLMRCQADPSIRRVVIGNFQFPLGVYPVEDLTPAPGYSMAFEQADGGSEGEWEEWPDRYAYDIVISAERLPTLVRSLMSLFDGRVYPILDVLGQDAFREIDPFISYELVGPDLVFDAIREYGDYFFEDGMCGFGAMSEEPFLYMFVDEHKILTVRAEVSLKERVERVLHAFDLEQTEEVAGADAAAHEHRAVLKVKSEDERLLSSEEVVEQLKDSWRLLLNVDPDTNLDDEGKDVGPTHWRAIVRCALPDAPPRYAEVLFDANNLRHAEEVAFDALEDMSTKEEMHWDDAGVLTLDRVAAEQFKQVLANAGVTPESLESHGKKKSKSAASKRKTDAGEPAESISPEPGRVYAVRWLE